MPYSPEQIKAIAAQKNRELGPEGTKRYMHKLKQEAIRKHGYFVKGKGKKKIRKKHHHA
jgi:hypothetical protein